MDCLFVVLNLLFLSLISLGILLPDLLLGYITKMLTCRIPLTTFLGVIGFSGALSFVRNRWVLKVVLGLIIITQIIQVNHWAYFGAPIHSQDISKVFFELDEIFQTGISLSHSLWPVWLTLVVSTGLIIVAPLYTKDRLKYSYTGILIFLILAITPVLSYIKGPSFFYTKPTYSTIYNTVRAFSDWLVRLDHKDKDFGYKPYTITYGHSKVKNIVLIVGESLSSRYMHLYGYKENNTPFLDSLKSMPNFIFAKGISSSVSTRACLQTFFNSFHNPGFLDLIRKKEANLFRLAKHQGYKTFVLSGQNEKLFHDTGTEFVDIFASEKDMRDALNEKGDEALLDKLSILELGEKNFIVIHLRHVHSPFNAYEKYRPELAKSIDHKNRTSQSQQEYSNAIAYHDYWVKQCILTIIKKMIIDETIYDDRIKPHIQDDTVILFTSDHGQLLGERGLFGHNQMQPEVADVPIWILAPKPALISSLKNQSIISHYDLAKYIATLFGATITNPNENSHLQYVHGSELYTDYEFMPWKIEKGQAIFLENQWVDEKKSA